MKKRSCLLIGMLLAFVLISAQGVRAVPNDLVTEELSSEEIEHFVESISVQLLTEQPLREAICCFDVSPDGLIAIGHDNGDDRVVEVLSEKGEFCYGFSFSSQGSFGLIWQGKELSVYFVRSDTVAFIDKDGTVSRVVRIRDSFGSNNDLYAEVFSPRKQAGGCIYELRNDMGVLNLFAISYSKLVCMDANGNSVTVYDANSEHMARIVLGIVLFLCFAFVSISPVIYNKSKAQTKKAED